MTSSAITKEENNNNNNDNKRVLKDKCVKQESQPVTKRQFSRRRM